MFFIHSMFPSDGPSLPASSNSLALLKQVKRHKSSTFERCVPNLAACELVSTSHFVSTSLLMFDETVKELFCSLMNRIRKGRCKGSFVFIVLHPKPVRKKMIVLAKDESVS